MRNPSYNSVKAIVQRAETWSINQLMRKLRTSYTRACFYTDRLIADGILTRDPDADGFRQTITHQ
jgi:hypothetical protein